MASAQRSRAAYRDTAATIAKLGLNAGDAFSGNDEMIRFTELMNKNFVIGGASAQEQTAAMSQLTQAMSSGRLQGDEYRSIIENAPLLAGAIEAYMRNVQGAEGSMKDWASEGLLTASVTKNALFSSADEVEARFGDMPKTWGQIWNEFSNQALEAFRPVLDRIYEIGNSERFQSFMNGAVGTLTTLGSVAVGVFDFLVSVGTSLSMVFDAVNYNEDRYFGNFGVLRDNRSGASIGAAPIFDNGLSPFNFATERDLADLQGYAKTRTTPYHGVSFEAVCRQVMGNSRTAQLCRLIGFRFQRHPRYNLLEPRLNAIEQQFDRRIRSLLDRPKEKKRTQERSPQRKHQ